MSEGYDVILIGLSRWDNELNSSVLNIASEWAKTNRVFYIDRPFSFKDYFIVREKEALRRSKALLFGKNKYERVIVNNQEIIAVTPKLSLPINFIPEGKIYDFFHAYNKRLIANTIANILDDYSVKNYVFFNSFIPEYFDVIKPNCLQPLVKIYRSSDDISQEPYIAKHGVRKERLAVLQADLVLVSSFGLQQKLSSIKTPIFRVPNAANFELFSEANAHEKPAELLRLSGRKTIFLAGNISQLRIDYALLYAIAKHFSDCDLVIAGPVQSKELVQFGLDKMANISWLGTLPLAHIAQILNHADCAIIPFLKNTLTAGIYPLKINEYLASGKPVVSTHFSEDIGAFSDCIYLAETPQEFIKHIEKALSEPKDKNVTERRQQIAKNNNWSARMAEIKALVEGEIGGKGLYDN